MKCPKCGANLLDGAQLCFRCGAMMSGQQTQSQPSQRSTTRTSQPIVPQKAAKSASLKVWKLVSGIISIVLSMLVIFQSCAAGVANTLLDNGEVGGSAGVIVAFMLLSGGIVSIAVRNMTNKGGNITIIVLYGIAALVGYMLAGSYSDLYIWSTWCLICLIFGIVALVKSNGSAPSSSAPKTQKSAAKKSAPTGAFRWWQIPIALLIFVLGFGVGSLTSSAPSDSKPKASSKQSEKVSLDGTWSQVNSNSDTTYQMAGISGNIIEIRWIDENTDTQSLYWVGSVDLPENPGSQFTWDSKNDTSKTSTAMLASNDESKTFTYKDGQLSFDVSMMGTTTTVKMEKVSDTPPDLTNSAETSSEPPAKQEPFKIGETWTVDGQWELTVTGVTETAERNEFSDKNPGAVYIVDFTYKNIGYVDDSGLMDGLLFNMDDTIVDCEGKMGESYPGDKTKYSQVTPVGASCDAQVCIAVENPGSFTLTVTKFDGNNSKQTATFEVAVE